MSKFGEGMPTVDNSVENMMSNRSILCPTVNELLNVYMEIGHPDPKNEKVFIDEVFKSFAAKKELYQNEKLRALIAGVLKEEVAKIKTNKQVRPNNDGMPLLNESDMIVPNKDQLSTAEMREVNKISSKAETQRDSMSTKHAVSRVAMSGAWHHKRVLGGDHEDEK